jgi:membrane-associated phospholipid phosphatase
MSRIFTFWLGGLLMTGLIVLISIAWVDRPIALLVHDAFGPRHFTPAVAGSPILSVPLVSALVFVLFGLSAMLGRKFSKPELAIVWCDISVLAAETIKDQLKYAFGRTWPDSWGPQSLSLIHDNAYGFHFFHSGHAYESFPSGHAAVVAAAMSILWFLFPKLRAAQAICVVAADVGLVLLNLHFVSDVVAGTFVGISVGLFTLALCASLSQTMSGVPMFEVVGLEI